MTKINLKGVFNSQLLRLFFSFKREKKKNCCHAGLQIVTFPKLELLWVAYHCKTVEAPLKTFYYLTLTINGATTYLTLKIKQQNVLHVETEDCCTE